MWYGRLIVNKFGSFFVFLIFFGKVEIRGSVLFHHFVCLHAENAIELLLF